MPEISRFYGIIITMYFMDHAPPHFHVRYNEWRAVIRLDDLTITEGDVPARVRGFVREWASAHRDELLANWARAQARQPLVKIAPLD